MVTGAVTLTSSVLGEATRDEGDTVSQLPPVAVEATGVKSITVPVLAIVMFWGSGFGPLCSMVKLIPFTCSNPPFPFGGWAYTCTVMGTVILVPALWKRRFAV